MKKVLFLTKDFCAGGIQSSAVELINYLLEKNCRVDVCCIHEGGVLESRLNSCSNLSIIQLKCRHIPLSRKKIAHLSIKGKLKWLKEYVDYHLCKTLLHLPQPFARHKHKGHYDAVIAYSWGLYCKYAINNVTADQKVLWYHHGVYNWNARYRKRDQKYFPKYSSVITVSQANKTMLEQHFDSSKVQFQVIHNMINEQRILGNAGLPVDESWINTLDGCRIVTVGRISPEKGQSLAIETARLLREKGFAFHWIFVGDGSHQEACEHLVDQYGLQDCCHFVGVKANPYSYMKLADIYVQPSLIESEGLTVLEAIALKKIVIASNIPALAETLQQGDLGILSDLTAEDFASKIVYYSHKEHQMDILNRLACKGSANAEIKSQIDQLLGL